MHFHHNAHAGLVAWGSDFMIKSYYSRRELNPKRFSRVDFRRYFVNALGNTKVLPAVISLSRQKSPTGKLRSTCQREIFE
jgi:hypothetical protein